MIIIVKFRAQNVIVNMDIFAICELIDFGVLDISMVITEQHFIFMWE